MLDPQKVIAYRDAVRDLTRSLSLGFECRKCGYDLWEGTVRWEEYYSVFYYTTSTAQCMTWKAIEEVLHNHAAIMVAWSHANYTHDRLNAAVEDAMERTGVALKEVIKVCGEVAELLGVETWATTAQTRRGSVWRVQ